MTIVHMTIVVFVIVGVALVAVLVQGLRQAARSGTFLGILQAYEEKDIEAAEKAIDALHGRGHLHGRAVALALLDSIRRNRAKYL